MVGSDPYNRAWDKDAVSVLISLSVRRLTAGGPFRCQGELEAVRMNDYHEKQTYPISDARHDSAMVHGR